MFQTSVNVFAVDVRPSNGPFIATQFNSTRRRVELRRQSVYSDSTQLNSTDLLRADWLYAATGSVALPIAGDS